MTEPHEERQGPWYTSPSYRRQIETQAGYAVGRWFGDVVSDMLWVGAAPRHAADYVDLLAASGVTHVLNVADDMEASTILRAPFHLEYLRIPFADLGPPPPDAWFEQGTEFALRAIAGGGVVYVHCLVGSARGPAMAYAIARRLGMLPGTARQAVLQARPLGSHYYLADAERWIGRR